MLADLGRHAAQRAWGLLSTAAHPGFTRTNLQTAGASLGRGSSRRSCIRCSFPSTSCLRRKPGRALSRCCTPRPAPRPPRADTTGRADDSDWSAPLSLLARPAGLSTPPPAPACGPRPSASPASRCPRPSPDRDAHACRSTSGRRGSRPAGASAASASSRWQGEATDSPWRIRARRQELRWTEDGIRWPPLTASASACSPPGLARHCCWSMAAWAASSGGRRCGER